MLILIMNCSISVQYRSKPHNRPGFQYNRNTMTESEQRIKLAISRVRRMVPFEKDLNYVSQIIKKKKLTIEGQILYKNTNKRCTNISKKEG